MTELDTIREWFAYNARARRAYLDEFAKLPIGELSRDRGASYPTLLRIFQHSLEAYMGWIDRATEGNGKLPHVGPGPDQILGEHPSVEAIREFESAVRDRVSRFLNALELADLDATFPIPKGGPFTREYRLTVRDMLWHLVEEELQHRGELNALLWQIDVEAPIYDWIDWSVDPTASAARDARSG